MNKEIEEIGTSEVICDHDWRLMIVHCQGGYFINECGKCHRLFLKEAIEKEVESYQTKLKEEVEKKAITGTILERNPIVKPMINYNPITPERPKKWVKLSEVLALIEGGSK